MRIAIATCDSEISNVFDFAHRLLLVDKDNGHERPRLEIDLVEPTALERAGRLKQLKVDVLICGAVSRPLASMIRNLGIELVPFVTGPTDEILKAYKEGRLDEQRYSLPCCWQGARRRFRRRGGHGRSNY